MHAVLEQLGLCVLWRHFTFAGPTSLGQYSKHYIVQFWILPQVVGNAYIIMEKRQMRVYNLGPQGYCGG
jgi:hypothetical protein